MSRSAGGVPGLALVVALLVAACSVAPAGPAASSAPAATFATPKAAPGSGASMPAVTAVPAFTPGSPFPAVLPTPQYPSSDADFELALDVPAAPQHAAEAIPITARLTYTGPEETVTVVGDELGLVGFYFIEIGGTKIMGTASRLMCGKPIVMQRGVAEAFTPPKSVGFDGNDPNASFYLGWAHDPQVHLTPGHWQVAAIALVWNGTTCYGHEAEHTLQTGWAAIDVLA
jgi:hypothetical protein